MDGAFRPVSGSAGEVPALVAGPGPGGSRGRHVFVMVTLVVLVFLVVSVLGSRGRRGAGAVVLVVLVLVVLSSWYLRGLLGAWSLISCLGSTLAESTRQPKVRRDGSQLLI